MNNTLIHLPPLHLRAETDEDPYFMIGEFFSYTSLHSCREWMHNWFKAAFSNEFILPGKPGDFLYSENQLKLLLYACNLLLEQPGKQPCTLTEEQRNQLRYARHRQEVIIKSLSIYDIAQPVTVIEGFFGFKDLEEWMLTLQHWEEAALGSTCITESEDAEELMPVMEWLYKITEAAWLVWLTAL